MLPTSAVGTCDCCPQLPTEVTYPVKLFELLQNIQVNNLFRSIPCADPESFVRGGPSLTKFLSLHEGREDLNTTISEPLSAG